MPALADEEVAQKLAQLKQYSKEFDAYERQWKASYGNKDAYLAMTKAESKYVALSDWLWSQGIDVVWERDVQEYVAKERNSRLTAV